MRCPSVAPDNHLLLSYTRSEGTSRKAIPTLVSYSSVYSQHDITRQTSIPALEYTPLVYWYLPIDKVFE